ncbi:hypothetical protein PG987_012108 [Apiospora arundinis]
MGIMSELITQSDNPISPKPLVEKDRNVVEKSILAQKRLHARASTSTRFNTDEKAALQIGTLEDATNYFQRHFRAALRTKRAFDQNHAHGAGSVTQKLNDSAASIYDTIQILSPIIDIIQDCGIPYAGIAMGTIIFFFAVAKNRQSTERRISAMLLTIQDRISGLKLYNSIYKENHDLDQQMRSKVVMTYNSFVEFCTAAIEYFELGRFVRWLKSLGFSTSLENKATRVQDAIVAVREVGEELLHKSSAEIQKKLDSVKEMNRNLEEINTNQTVEIIGLQNRIKDLQESQDSQDLESIRQALELGPFSLEAELLGLEKRDGNIKAQFRLDYASGKRVTDRLTEIELGATYRSWKESLRSRVLVLAGRNQVIQASHCWLSPMGIGLVRQLNEASPPELYTFHMVGERGMDDTYEHTLSTLVYRLLSQHRHILRNQAAYDQLWTALQGYRSLRANEHSAKHVLHRELKHVALTALNMFDSDKTIWIILDRLDQCQNAMESRNYHRKAILKSLVSLVEDKELKVRLRVLVVVNSLDWNVEEQKDEFGQTEDGSLVIQTISQTRSF